MPNPTAIGAFLTHRRSLLLLLLIGVGFLHPLWTTSDIVYSKDSDIIAEHLGTKVVEREGLAEGSLPLWNPSMNGGLPALANPQAQYLFPFDLLFLVLPLGLATNLVILLNTLLAGVAMFVFCRRYFAHPAAALICGVAYMLSHRFLAMIYAGWLPKLSMFALVPLIFWACDLILEARTPRRIAAVAAVGALALLQGDMQQLYYAGIGGVVWLAIRLTAAGWRQSGPAIRSLAIGAVIAAALAAPALLPRLQFASLSTRSEASYTFLLRGSPAPAELMTFFDPIDRTAGGEVRNGFWENNFYFGYWMAPLWVLAFCANRRRAGLLLLGIAAAAFLCFDTPILRAVFASFPGFSLFRQSPRILFLAQFAGVFLAGLGADALLDPGGGRRRVRLFAGSAIALAVIGCLMPLPAGRGATCAICGLMALAGAAALAPRLGALAAAGLLLVSPVVDACLRISPLIVAAPLADILPRHGFHDLLDRRRNAGRVLAISPTSSPSYGRAALLYGTAACYGIDMINGVTALELRSYSEYFNLMKYGSVAALPRRPMGWTDCSQISKPEMLRALDVRYLIGHPSLYIEAMGAERVWQSPSERVFIYTLGMRSIPIAVWRLRDPLGPAYFATSVRPVDNDDESLRRLELSSSAREASVFASEADLGRLDFSGGTAAFLERGLNRYRYRVESAGNNFLILSQVWYPGWRATLDGKPLPLYRTNHALTGCVVPRGRHELVLKMTCPPFLWGLAAAAAGAAALAFLIFAAPARRSTRA